MPAQPGVDQPLGFPVGDKPSPGNFAVRHLVDHHGPNRLGAGGGLGGDFLVINDGRSQDDALQDDGVGLGVAETPRVALPDLGEPWLSSSAGCANSSAPSA
jgi:hypothetical protein